MVFVNIFHFLYIQAVKVLMRLHVCAGSSEFLLLANGISTKISSNLFRCIMIVPIDFTAGILSLRDNENEFMIDHKPPEIYAD